MSYVLCKGHLRNELHDAKKKQTVLTDGRPATVAMKKRIPRQNSWPTPTLPAPSPSWRQWHHK